MSGVGLGSFWRGCVLKARTEKVENYRQKEDVRIVYSKEACLSSAPDSALFLYTTQRIFTKLFLCTI
jgi:hypothetical protein